MKSPAGPLGGGGWCRKCRNMFSPKKTNAQPRIIRAMTAMIFINVNEQFQTTVIKIFLDRVIAELTTFRRHGRSPPRPQAGLHQMSAILINARILRRCGSDHHVLQQVRILRASVVVVREACRQKAVYRKTGAAGNLHVLNLNAIRQVAGLNFNSPGGAAQTQE